MHVQIVFGRPCNGFDWRRVRCTGKGLWLLLWCIVVLRVRGAVLLQHGSGSVMLHNDRTGVLGAHAEYARHVAGAGCTQYGPDLLIRTGDALIFRAGHPIANAVVFGSKIHAVVELFGPKGWRRFRVPA